MSTIQDFYALSKMHSFPFLLITSPLPFQVVVAWDVDLVTNIIFYVIWLFYIQNVQLYGRKKWPLHFK